MRTHFLRRTALCAGLWLGGLSAGAQQPAPAPQPLPVVEPPGGPAPSKWSVSEITQGLASHGAAVG